MQILHINQSDVSGGAGIAGYRLHQGLLKHGINSHILANVKKTMSEHVTLVPHNYRLENALGRLTNPIGLNHLKYVASFDITKYSFYQSANVLNFHNLHTGFFNYLALPPLTRNKPAVFTLHDMWSFTGHCAYSYDCMRWQSGCGQCPYPDTYPAIRQDSTRIEWRLKDWVYSRSNITIVTPSHWLTEQVKKSMLQRFPIHFIPYGIDLDAYQPLDPKICRTALGLPQNKQVLLFSADNLQDSRKGGDLLLSVLQNLPVTLKNNLVLLTFGSGGESLAETVGIPVLALGYINSDRLKSVAFSAADIFIFPTKADNLPLVLQESMACGTPMVSFKVGGVPDLVRHGITGYLAQPKDVEDFRNGVIQLLVDSELRHKMKSACRQIAVSEYSLDLQIYRYTSLYKEILK